MKPVFYPHTMCIDGLTISDRVVYSQIVYQSILNGGQESFDLEGHFKTPDESLFWSRDIVVSTIPDSTIYGSLHISKSQFYLSVKNLEETKFISSCGEKSRVSFTSDVVDYYIELKSDVKKIKGISLLDTIVYSYLANKTEKYGWVDKYRSSIADELNMSEGVLYNCLAKLTRAGLIEKKHKGKRQVILRTI